MNHTKKEPLVEVQPIAEILRQVRQFTLLVIIFLCSVGFVANLMMGNHMITLELGVGCIICQIWYLIGRSTN